MSRKVFIGRVLSVTNSKVIMSTTDPAHGDAIALQAGAVVLEQARQLQGRVVRFVAEVSEATKCLSNPQFVIGSEFGLQAVAPRERIPFGSEGWTQTADGSKVYDERGHSFACECRDCG